MVLCIINRILKNFYLITITKVWIILHMFQIVFVEVSKDFLAEKVSN